MSYLPQGFANTPHLLGFNVVDDFGFLKDPSAIGFQIFDPDGAQDFPAVPGNYHDVRTVGRVGTGRFYAYDAADGWAPDAAADVGSWRIRWRWKVKATDDWSYWSERFDVVESYDADAGTGFRGVNFRTYVTPAQARDAGLLTSDLSDPQLETLIQATQAYIDQATRQFFRPIFDTVRVNGTDGGKLFFGLPIIGVESVFANGSYSQTITRASETDSILAIAFNRTDLDHVYRPKPDHRRNPSIAYRANPDVFAGSGFFDSSVFRAGRLNQTIKAVWGFVEADGTTPQLIQEAMLRLVFANYEGYTLGTAGATAPLKSWTVDRHSESYDTSSPAATLNSALATSRKVEEILGMYRSPIGLSSPGPNPSKRFRI